MAKGHVIVDGFTVIPVKLSEKCESCHYLYCKSHSARVLDQHTPKDRTLFVVGVPPYCKEESLQLMFSQCGKIDRIILSDKPSNQPKLEEMNKFFPNGKKSDCFRVAYIVFKNSKGLEKACTLVCDQPLLMTSKECKVETGVAKWCTEYQESHSMDTKQLQEEIDNYMTQYDERAEKESKVEKDQDGVPDDDGWITVTKSGKFKGMARTEALQGRMKTKEKKKRKDKELLNFYTFQIRESKRERIADLRKKFEEDKQKIASLKISRRFKPF